MTVTSHPLKPSDIDDFHRQGYVRLNGLHTKARMAAIKERVLSELSRLKIWNKGRSVGGSLNALPPFQQIAKLSAMVKLDLQDLLNTPDVRHAILGLTDTTAQSEQGPQLLLSLPHQGRWSLNGLNWHVDIAAQSGDDIPGVQAFYLLDNLAPRGGATLALARSHRMSGEAARALRASLKSPADAQTALRTFDTEVIEMAGRAGDVFLMDMRVLHTPSINASKHVRMMATTRFLLRP